ncbi:MAG: RNA polymerase sigma factor [Candidatus Liptonbacteria bacterium]
MGRHNNQEANKERIAALYDEHADAIHRYCFFRIYNEAKAEELMQDAFLKMWRYLEEGKNVENERALLYVIATHLIIDDKRKVREERLDDILENEEAPHPASSYDPSSRARLREVREEVSRLSPEEQNLFALRYVSDLDPKDIAEIMGTSANVISVQLNRIISKIRGKLV